MDETTDLEEKYKLILKGFLHKNYKNQNDIYFEQLFTHLSGKNGQKTDYKSLLHSPITLEWIDQCLDASIADFKKMDEKVFAFMLKLTALLTENEWLIPQLRERKIADKIEELINANLTELTPSIKLGYIYFLSAISKYSIGISRMKFNNAWEVLIHFCKSKETIYVKRQATALLFEIFVKLSTKIKDEEICVAIIAEIMKPINENIYTDQTLSVCVDDNELQGKVSAAFDLLLYFLQNSLEIQTNFYIASYFEPPFEIDKMIWKYIDTFHDQYFVGKLLKILTALNYTRLLLHKSKKGKISEEDFTQFGVNFYNYMKFCIMRRSCDNVLLLAEYNKVLWTKLNSEVPDEIVIENEKINFGTQLATIQLMPILIFLKPNYEEYCSEIVDDYVTKIFNITNEFTQRIAYSIRDLLLDCPENAVHVACKAISGILSMKNSLNQAQAVLIFQAMTYALKSFLPVKKEHEANGSAKKANLNIIFRENSNIMYSLVVGLHSIVEHFKITWKDSIETTCILTIVLGLLDNPDLTSRVTVQLVKLAQLSIERFLSPNMALLMNNLNESGMQNFESIMLKRLHDNSWEVRDSTLELITTVVTLSEMKFPPFQQFILDSGVSPIVYSMAQNDSEPYIRASALKCLAEMTKIDLMWDKSLSQMDIMKFALSFIPKESEGIVRKEAVILVRKIFVNRKYTVQEPNKLFSVMAYCAVNDFYWEVKVHALHFWKAVICKQFTNQGMIDGTFPTVTFSKQHKKIVTLTEKEILIRIQRILDDLCKYGILGILLECLQDECDFEVVKETVNLLQKLLDCLNKYDFFKTINLDKENNQKLSSSSSSFEEAMESDCMDFQENIINENGMDISELSETAFNENVIDSILDSSDLNLLAYGYQTNHMNAENACNNNFDVIDDKFHKKFANITPEIFLNKITKINLNSLIEMKQNWISENESFESLLDDMIYSIKTLGVNDADCY
ncbi:uncharacterized protein LOC129605721 [Condylostylus longicornis]|uniref:uncharacterized protein LOC129605721 n=1 Tax=Condylostylus longicornis TaxID=2530218 RepID=UPI00244E1A50|nr:uncharacterized protein LOC129605721 [Condylostylus longicornis]